MVHNVLPVRHVNARHGMARVCLIALVSAAGGCGTRTPLEVGSPRDGGAGVDAIVIDGGAEIEALCGRRDRYSSPRRSIAIEAESRSTAPIVREGWDLVSAPAGSVAEPAPTEGTVTALTPDVVGDFQLRFTVRDRDGRTASCDVVVHSVVGPPVAICPESPELVVAVDRSLRVEGDGYDDDGVVGYLWRIVEAAPGSSPQIVPADAPVTDFITDVPGRYVLSLTVTDVDGAMDACEVVVRVTAPPVVECPAEEIVAPTRRETVIRARASDDEGVVSMRWEVLERPPGSTAEPTPRDAEVTRLTPDRAGVWVLAFTATDSAGLSSTCTVTVRATPTPPDAICPMTLVTTPLSTVEVMGAGVDDGRIVSYRWALVSRPPASSADPPAPSDAARTRFTPDVAGEYVLRLTVTDDHGETATCDVLVQAVPQEGLRVEVFWNPPDRSCDDVGGPMCDDTDVDTHLLRPGTEPWFDFAGDCHYANCTGGGLDWGAPGPADDPRLDLDDVEGFGPENINVDRPVPGTYRVGVHLFDGASLGRASVTVNIYCGMSTTPARTFGPTVLTGSSGPDRNPFWRVADVTLGAACSITDLSVAGRPNITTSSEAQRVR